MLNIYVAIPNLVGQMHISDFIFVSVVKQRLENKTGDGQDLASEAHPAPSTHQLSHPMKQGRHQARDAYTWTYRRPPLSHISHHDPRNTAAPGIRKEVQHSEILYTKGKISLKCLAKSFKSHIIVKPGCTFDITVCSSFIFLFFIYIFIFILFFFYLFIYLFIYFFFFVCLFLRFFFSKGKTRQSLAV